jgi:co-chaperonin GroES (HSP10)
MEAKEHLAMLGKPEIEKLKAIGGGIKVARVCGRRLLVKPVTPFTEMDRLEKQGILYAPQTAKEANTPKPTVGVIVLVGDMVEGDFKEGEGVMFTKFAGSDIMVENEAFRIVHEDEILCTLDDTESVVVPVKE